MKYTVVLSVVFGFVLQLTASTLVREPSDLLKVYGDCVTSIDRQYVEDVAKATDKYFCGLTNLLVILEKKRLHLIPDQGVGESWLPISGLQEATTNIVQKLKSDYEAAAAAALAKRCSKLERTAVTLARRARESETNALKSGSVEKAAEWAKVAEQLEAEAERK